jgi:hypothetical protein
MRVRILRKPPPNYGVDIDSLLVGRVYNLSAALASALMIEGYAELYETLTADEKRERSDEASRNGWTAADDHRRWFIPRKTRKR